MNWFRLLRHDIRSGLLRLRYLCVPLIFGVTCFHGWTQIYGTGYASSWMDYIMYCFKGIPPISNIDGFEFPILWFLVMAGCLYINLDYPLNDLTEAGQQLVIRSVNKKSWFLSKCVWNFLSCGLYLGIGLLTALGPALLSGGSIYLTNTPEITTRVLQVYTEKALAVPQTLAAAVLLPYLTITAFNLLQMTLCLVVKPIFSFLICVCLLVISMFTSSPFVLGNGAMLIRSGILTEALQAPWTTAFTCLAVIACSIVVGIILFGRMDHLRYEG